MALLKAENFQVQAQITGGQILFWLNSICSIDCLIISINNQRLRTVLERRLWCAYISLYIYTNFIPELIVLVQPTRHLFSVGPFSFILRAQLGARVYCVLAFSLLENLLLQHVKLGPN